MPNPYTGVRELYLLNLSGCRGLITAIITLSLRDAIGRDRTRKADALEYFNSDVYVYHLDLLGIDCDMKISDRIRLFSELGEL